MQIWAIQISWPSGAWLLRDNIKTLVVGTTPDYVDWIRQGCPRRALFITDPFLRLGSKSPVSPQGDELLCDLSDYGLVSQALKRHLQLEGLSLDGVACYDCESMELTALLAREYALPYPSVQAIRNCRNKYISKTLWQKNNLCTPRARIIRSEKEAALFLRELKTDCVLKPLSGSGSELIYHCNTELQCKRNFREIKKNLIPRRTHRL